MGPLSPCNPYPLTRVRRSTLDFRTGNSLKVLNLLHGGISIHSTVPWTTAPQFTIVNSDRTDSRYDCLLQNAGTPPLTFFAPIALKQRGASNANRVRDIEPCTYTRSVPTVNAVG